MTRTDIPRESKTLFPSKAEIAERASRFGHTYQWSVAYRESVQLRVRRTILQIKGHLK